MADQRRVSSTEPSALGFPLGIDQNSKLKPENRCLSKNSQSRSVRRDFGILKILYHPGYTLRSAPPTQLFVESDPPRLTSTLQSAFEKFLEEIRVSGNASFARVNAHAFLDSRERIFRIERYVCGSFCRIFCLKIKLSLNI